MKKRTLLLSVFIACFMGLSAQVEMLRNASFEYWNNFSAATELSFWKWENTGAQFEQEQVDKLEGFYALKATNNSNTENTFFIQAPYGIYSEQDYLIADKPYQLTFKYKVLTSNGGQDVKLWSNWTKPDDVNPSLDHFLTSDHEVAKLHTSYETSSDWKTVTVDLVAPADVCTFMFKVTINANTVVLFDDFSFKQIMSATDTYLSISPIMLPEMHTEVNSSVKYTKVHFAYNGISKEDIINFSYLSGTDRNQFSYQVIDIDDKHFDIEFTYNPSSPGVHTKCAYQISVNGQNQMANRIQLSGYAVDPANLPSITLDKTVIPNFTCNEGETKADTIRVTPVSCIDYVYVKVLNTQGSAFKINKSMITRWAAENVEIKFAPQTSGHFEADVVVYTRGGTSKTLHVTGDATVSGSSTGEVYESDFNFDLSNPLSIMNEKFATITHNKKLTTARWQNIMKTGQHGFWGYNEKNLQTGDIINTSAKITAYNSLDKTKTAVETWLVTPALDFKNAATKVFSCSVLQQYKSDNQAGKLELYYIDATPGKDVFYSKLNIGIPAKASENNEWKGVEIDLSGQENISDVFFIAFKFTGETGPENPTTYLIDNVTWGDPNRPTITPSDLALDFVAELNKDKNTKIIQVATKNVTRPMTLKVGGSNPSKFKLSETTLPANGGVFYSTFNSDQIGIHEAFVSISSFGAVTRYITMTARNRKGSSIETTEAKTAIAYVQDNTLHILSDNMTNIQLFSITGQNVYNSNTINTNEFTLPIEFNSGVYVIRIQTAHGVETVKVNL